MKYLQRMVGFYLNPSLDIKKNLLRYQTWCKDQSLRHCNLPSKLRCFLFFYTHSFRCVSSRCLRFCQKDKIFEVRIHSIPDLKHFYYFTILSIVPSVSLVGSQYVIFQTFLQYVIGTSRKYILFAMCLLFHLTSVLPSP